MFRNLSRRFYGEKVSTINSSYQIRFFRIVENLYVNGEYRDDSAIESWMHDFNCADADDMHYGLLAERTRYPKEKFEGSERDVPDNG